MNKICGIYRIVNMVNGKSYIGKALSIYSRWQVHKYHLRKNTHHSRKLQNAWNKYGEHNFRLEIVLECNQDSLLASEEHAITSYDSYHSGYNCTLKAGKDATGIKRSEEFKSGISKRNKGRIVSEESKERMRAAKLGTKASKETLIKMSKSQTGKKLSSEHRAKIGKSVAKSVKSGSDRGGWKLGTRHSEETKKKISQTKLKRRNNVEA
jgi:group I intron endonuclease